MKLQYAFRATLLGPAICLVLAGCARKPAPPPVEEAARVEQPAPSVEENLESADAYLEKGRVGEAAKLYAEVLEQEPGSFQANLGSGIALLTMEEGKYENQRDYAAVREHFEAARSARPEDPRPYAYLGTISYDQKHYADAAADLEKAADLDPGNAKTAELLGLALAEAGRTDEARRELHRALGIDPLLADAHLGLGKIYEKAGDNSQAREHFETALRWKPQLHMANYYLERIYYEEKSYDKAADQCRKFLEFYPDDIQSLEILGNISRLQGSEDETFRIYSRLTKVDPENTSYWSPVIQYLTDRKDYDAARRVLEEALSHNPYYAFGNVHYGKILMHFADGSAAAGDRQRADELYRLALEHLERARVDDRYADTAAKLIDMINDRLD